MRIIFDEIRLTANAVNLSSGTKTKEKSSCRVLVRGSRIVAFLNWGAILMESLILAQDERLRRA